MSRPVVALCHWQYWDGSTFASNDVLPTACRASLGEKVVTVWLPQGAVIRKRIRLCDPMRTRFGHIYGSHERLSRTRIQIELRELPTPEVLA